MRLTVIGGTGRIGRLAVEQALAQGHAVTLLVRDPQNLGSIGERVRVVAGQVTDAKAVARAIEGANAVISALGPDGNRADQVVVLRDGAALLPLGGHGRSHGRRGEHVQRGHVLRGCGVMKFCTVCGVVTSEHPSQRHARRR